MKETVQLQIPTPCDANWDKMTATEQGRFCMACKKEVVDFSGMSDASILQYLASAKSNICGKANHDQLNRNLMQATPPRAMWWKYWIGLAASLIMLATRSQAQAKIVGDTIVTVLPIPIESPVKGKILMRPESAKEIMVTGIVMDDTNTAVPGASVIIKDSSQGTATNEKGKFSLKTDRVKNMVLHVSAAGLEMKEVKLNEKELLKNNLRIRLKLSATMGLVGEVVVVQKNNNKNLLSWFKKNSTVRSSGN